ncbi:MBL fold metallo-hydrolase [Candidatus Giovannonibacteria bacterium]|nr:MBL fold metallo-hydrolase [Candidatus Giovannonibacteria bacterium]
MKITKFGHACMLVEENGVRVLIDPGNYSESQNDVKNVDAILITHEHQDHLDLNSLKQILNNNAETRIITNGGVGVILKKENIKFDLVEGGQFLSVGGLLIEGYGKDHAVIHSSIPLVRNTGYFISKKFFYPGDILTTDPGRKIEIMALPVAGPWMRLSDGIDYALDLKPKICFPVHDGMLKIPGPTQSIPAKILESKGIKFDVFDLNIEYEI